MLIDILLEEAVEKGCSDIHLVCGYPPRGRKNGSIVDLADQLLTDEDCEQIGKTLAGNRFEEIRDMGELDLAGAVGEHRIRINLFRQQGHLSAAIRILNDRIPALSELGLPPAVSEFPTYKKGIVLVTGETGSGKSTTLAAVLNEINLTRKAHIITLEDPIEYVYKPGQCVINQREIGRDTKSFDDGLRAILREDPDVILIGELRDRNTIDTALTAAETGHLVFATLHTSSAAESIDRMVGVFPADYQNQIRLQISTCLRAVLTQQLLVRRGGKGRVAACELMMVTPGIRNLIREGKTPQIANSLATSAAEGSLTMDNALIGLWKRQIISAQTAREAARDADYVRKNVF